MKTNTMQRAIPVLLSMFLIGITVLMLSAAAVAQRAGQTTAPASPGTALKSYGQLPFYFEANQGQADPEVRFLSRGRGYSLLLTRAEAVLIVGPSAETRGGLGGAANKGVVNRPGAGASHSAVGPSVFQLKLVGANPDAEVAGDDELPGRSNYFKGRDPSRWRAGIPQYRRVRYEQVYPGIDLIYHGEQGQLEYDFAVAPGADPAAIRLQIVGADRIAIDAHGALWLRSVEHSVRFQKPRIYQEGHGTRQEIVGEYVLTREGQVAFKVGVYDPSLPLIIDPLLDYSTYLDSASSGLGIVVDSAGNAYVSGYADGPGGGDALVAKISPDGSQLLYSTHLGGSLVENFAPEGAGIAVDSQGNAYITGNTVSSDFPTTPGAFQTQCPADPHRDAFVAKLNPSGNLLYSTCLGGSDDDAGLGITVDGAGNAFVAGLTSSPDFPLKNPLQAELRSVVPDAFVAELNASGSALVYSTYVGGNNWDEGDAIALDADGNVYVTGQTASTDFPTASAFQSGCGSDGQCDGGLVDAFVAKLNPSGSALVYSTYLGGSQQDAGFGIAVDGGGNAYIGGATYSPDFPTANPFQATLGGGFDAFVSKLNPAGSALAYSTYLGGSAGDDYGFAIAVDGQGKAYLVGATISTSGLSGNPGSDSFSNDFPVANPLQASYIGAEDCLSDGGCWLDYDAFLSELDAPGSSLLFSTYLAGSLSDIASGVATDVAGNIYVTGTTWSEDLPLENALQTTQANQSAFLLKVAPSALLADVEVVQAGAPDTIQHGESVTYTITVANHGPAPATEVVLRDEVRSTPAEPFSRFSLTSVVTSQGSCDGVGTCTLGTLAANTSATVTVVVATDAADRAESVLTNTARVIRSNVSDSVPANNSASVETQIAGFRADLSLVASASPASIAVGQDLSYTFTVTNLGPDSATNVFVDTDRFSTLFSYQDISTTCPDPNCGMISLAPSASATWTWTIQIVSVNPGTASIDNHPSVRSGETDPDPANNTASLSTPVDATPPTVEITPSPQSQTVSAGGSAVYNLTFVPAGGFSGSLSLACSGLPFGANCSFSSNPTTVSGGPATTTLTITTTGPTAALPTRPPAAGPAQAPAIALWLGLPFAMTLIAAGRTRTGQSSTLAAAVLVLAVLAFLTSCGGGGTSVSNEPRASVTPSGSYSVTVTGASGNTQFSTPVGLVVR